MIKMRMIKAPILIITNEFTNTYNYYSYSNAQDANASKTATTTAILGLYVVHLFIF